ncbi:MAG: hypothetical protein QXE31_03170 [Candidatus Woesearchaeota archaeon]
MKSKNKKSQISIFIIIGLIILITTLLIINLTPKKIKITSSTKNNTIKQNLENPDYYYVKDRLEKCINNLSEEAILKISNQGLLNPKEYISSNKIVIGYLYYDGKKNIQNEKELSNSIAEYIKRNIESCAKKEYIEIDKDNINVIIVLLKDEINIKAEFSEKINYKNKKIDITEIYVNKKSNLLNLVKAANKIINNLDKDEWLNLNGIDDEKIKVNIIKISEKTWIYEIIQINETENNNSLYRFAIKY